MTLSTVYPFRAGRDHIHERAKAKAKLFRGVHFLLRSHGLQADFGIYQSFETGSRRPRPRRSHRNEQTQTGAHQRVRKRPSRSQSLQSQVSVSGVECILSRLFTSCPNPFHHVSGSQLFSTCHGAFYLVSALSIFSQTFPFCKRSRWATNLACGGT